MRAFNGVAAAVLIGLTAGVTGCGSGDEDSSPPLTKAQLIKQGDRICQEAEDRRNVGLRKFIREAEEGKGTPSQAQQEELVLTVALPPFQEEAEELAELTPPEGDEDELQAIVDALEEAVERVEADPASVLTGAESQFSEAEKLGREYGFEECGRS